MVILSPLSTFDRRSADSARETDALKQRLEPIIPVHDLTPVLHAAQEGEGEILIERQGTLTVFDQESGETWLEVPAPRQGLPSTLYDLFENQPEVEEYLFFDGAHPNAEGFDVFAKHVATLVQPLLDSR